MLQPDGTIRSVEYSAGPKTGFTALVNNENSKPPAENIARSLAEPKAMRDFDNFYDISEDFYEDDSYERKWNDRPFDPYKENDYPRRKRPKYPFDLEPSEYKHSITIKHPRDENAESEETAHSHVGYTFDPNCKTKTKKESYDNKDNSYASIVDYELNKANKYSNFPPDSFRETYDKFAEPSNFEFQKIRPYGNNKYSKYEELRPSSSMKHNYPASPVIPDKYYSEDMPPPKPKKRKRPTKVREYSSDDLDDYILVPKKKYKPIRDVDLNDYRPESEEEYERPSYSSNYDDQDDRFHPIRSSATSKEVVRKIVKKRRPPIVNLLDIFDIWRICI